MLRTISLIIMLLTSFWAYGQNQMVAFVEAVDHNGLVALSDVTIMIGTRDENGKNQFLRGVITNKSGWGELYPLIENKEYSIYFHNTDYYPVYITLSSLTDSCVVRVELIKR